MNKLDKLEPFKDVLKTSEQWHKSTCPELVILDPDGWDRTNYQHSFFEEEITHKQFISRLIVSTTVHEKNYNSRGTGL